MSAVVLDPQTPAPRSAMQTNGMLDLRSISVRFGGLVAVDNVSLSVKANEVFGLLGPNGAGKTTLFNIIAGVQPPDDGDILYKGSSIVGTSVPWRARHGIARTFQITQPFGALTVLENVMVGGMLRESRHASLVREAEEILEYVGLSAKRDMRAEGLSTGQRKRLELARALATKPKLLLMDEVTGGVDQPSIPGLIALVRSLRDKGLTIVIIEHNMDVIGKLCDRVLFMNQGRKLLEGAPSVVMKDPAVVNLYLGDQV